MFIYLFYRLNILIRLNGTLGHSKCHPPFVPGRWPSWVMHCCLSACLKRVWPLALAACKLFNNRDTLPSPPPHPSTHRYFRSDGSIKIVVRIHLHLRRRSIQIFCFEIVHFVGLVPEGEPDSLQSPTYSPRCL